MKKKLIIIIGILVVVSAASAFIVTKVKNKTDKKSDRIEITRRGPFVVRLKERGNLDSLVKVEVRSNVEGEVEKLYVDEGYDVVKGQELLKIDEKQIREEFNQAQANYNAAQAELERAKENAALNADKMKSDIQLAENSLKSAIASLEETKARATQQISQAEISISNIRNLLIQDEISLRKATLALEQSESARKSAEAKLNNAKAELDRKKELASKKFVAQREVENAQLEYASALSQYESAENNVESQKENVESQKKIIESRKESLRAEENNLKILKESLDEQRKQAEIQVKQAQERLDIQKKSEISEKQIALLAMKTAEANKIRAQSALNTARQRLGWTTVLAPISGRIIQCKVEEGEIITSGRTAWSQGPPIMTIADLSKMIVKTQIHELDISKVKIGQKAEIRVSTYPDDIFIGEVKEISPSAQFVDNVIRFEVTVMVTESPKVLLPGMTADVDIIIGERANVLQLPLEAVDTRETIKIKTDIKRELIDKLRDKKVDIVLKNFPDKKFPGKVASISSEKTGLMSSEVTIIMEGSPKELQSGITTTADIIISENDKIPNIEARIDSEKGYYVQLVKEESTKTEGKKLFIIRRKKENIIETEDKMIKVGERTQNSIEILDGLKEGDKVKIVPLGEEKGKNESKR